MADPYRWGDAPPKAVVHAQERRQNRLDAAEYFRLTGMRIGLTAPPRLQLAREQIGWPRNSAQSLLVAGQGLPPAHRDEQGLQ